MISNPEALANIQKHAEETLEKRTAHEIEYRLSKVKGDK
jgi:anti-sigma regulatory factor (Ser/Thr protein kinase)